MSPAVTCLGQGLSVAAAAAGAQGGHGPTITLMVASAPTLQRPSSSAAQPSDCWPGAGLPVAASRAAAAHGPTASGRVAVTVTVIRV
jgi:hypothetical protein